MADVKRLANTTWIPVTMPGQQPGPISGAAVDLQGRFVLCGERNVYTSLDGLNWRDVTPPLIDQNGQANSMQDPVASINKDGIVLCTSSAEGSPFSYGISVINYNNDFNKFEEVSLTHGFGTTSITSDEQGRFISVGDTGIIAVSEKGLSAETANEYSFSILRDFRSAMAFFGVVYKDNVILAVGNGGNILGHNYSNGMFWWPANPTANHLRSVAGAGNGKFVAVGTSGVVVISENNGASWHSVESGVTSTLRAVAIRESDGKIIAGGLDGCIISSVDGGKTWDLNNNGCDPNVVIDSLVVSPVTGQFLAGGYRITGNENPTAFILRSDV